MAIESTNNGTATSSVSKNAHVSLPEGHVLRVSGTIVDVQFPREAAPDIFNELHVTIPEGEDGSQTVATLEVEQQLGDGAVRCIAIDSIVGIRRGLVVKNTGAPIQVPVGQEVLGRIFNVLALYRAHRKSSKLYAA